MSTKAIRELIERAKRDAAPIARSAVGWPDAGLMADKALLEVDAIERACKDVVDVTQQEDLTEHAWDTFSAIAKDAL